MSQLVTCRVCFACGAGCDFWMFLDTGRINGAPFCNELYMAASLQSEMSVHIPLVHDSCCSWLVQSGCQLLKWGCFVCVECLWITFRPLKCMRLGCFRSPKLMLCLAFVSNCSRLSRWFTNQRMDEVIRVTLQQGEEGHCWFSCSQRVLKGNNCETFAYRQSFLVHLSCVCELGEGCGTELCLLVVKAAAAFFCGTDITLTLCHIYWLIMFIRLHLLVEHVHQFTCCGFFLSS